MDGWKFNHIAQCHNISYYYNIYRKFVKQSTDLVYLWIRYSFTKIAFQVSIFKISYIYYCAICILTRHVIHIVWLLSYRLLISFNTICGLFKPSLKPRFFFLENYTYQNTYLPSPSSWAQNRSAAERAKSVADPMPTRQHSCRSPTCFFIL